jgi:hypothetical protein
MQRESGHQPGKEDLIRRKIKVNRQKLPPSVIPAGDGFELENPVHHSALFLPAAWECLAAMQQKRTILVENRVPPQGVFRVFG